MKQPGIPLLLITAVLVLGTPGIYAQPKGLHNLEISNPQLVHLLTSRWEGERSNDGRPIVPDGLLDRMKNVSVTMAWSIVTEAGYPNCYESAANWMVLHPDSAVVGRVLTARYMPLHPEISKSILDQGKKEGRIGNPNSWPIDMLQKGDVYVADCFGKIVDGTLIGDNLGNAIYANSGNGVILDAGVRDLEGIKAIRGFNAWYRGVDPSFLKDVMLTGINVPVRIGSAIACPGDVVLAKSDGIIFIPAHLAEKVVTESEAMTLRDMFGHERLREGKYTPGQIDNRWTPGIIKDFENWLNENMHRLPVPIEVIEKIIKSDKRNW